MAVRRLHRKLQVRRRQRGQGRSCWTLEEGAKVNRSEQDGEWERRGGEENKMYVCSTTSSTSSLALDRQRSSSYVVPLVAPCSTQSPYTGRTLKPFIRRDFGIASQRILVHRELAQRVNG